MEDELNIEEIKTIRLLAFDKVNKDMKEEITKVMENIKNVSLTAVIS